MDREKKFLESSFTFQKDNKCSYFPFLALYEGTGLGPEADGILGLAPQKSIVDREKNYIWSLTNNGIISRPILSMSLSNGEIADEPYALFGGYNSSQIVGGEAGLATFRNNRGDYKSAIKSWALPAKDLMYNGVSLGYGQ